MSADVTAADQLVILAALLRGSVGLGEQAMTTGAITAARARLDAIEHDTLGIAPDPRAELADHDQLKADDADVKACTQAFLDDPGSVAGGIHAALDVYATRLAARLTLPAPTVPATPAPADRCCGHDPDDHDQLGCGANVGLLAPVRCDCMRPAAPARRPAPPAASAMVDRLRAAADLIAAAGPGRALAVNVNSDVIRGDRVEIHATELDSLRTLARGFGGDVTVTTRETVAHHRVDVRGELHGVPMTVFALLSTTPTVEQLAALRGETVTS